jgi:putative DNA primase/helicase
MQRSPLKNRAQGRWFTILPSLGIGGQFLRNRHGPCPMCGGKDRFRFDNLEDRGTFICSHCGSGDGVTLLMKFHSWDFQTAALEIEKIIGDDGAPAPPAPTAPRPPSPIEEADHAALLKLWREAKPITPGDPADLYLRSRIGTYAPTRALRFHPQTPCGGLTLPGLLSAYVDYFGDLAGLQRTFLTVDGQKVGKGISPRMTMGKLPERGAVRLAKHDAILGIAEGVETALSATRLFGVPVWAALNANRLKVWQPPEGVRDVIIFGDNDISSTGQAAAFAVAERLNRDGCTTQVMIPPDLGTDWNDVLNAKHEEGVPA